MHVCPFCGGTPHYATTDDDAHSIVCSACGAMTPGYSTVDEAAAAWKRRYEARPDSWPSLPHPSSGLPSELDRLRALEKRDAARMLDTWIHATDTQIAVLSETIRELERRLSELEQRANIASRSRAWLARELARIITRLGEDPR